MQAARTLPTSMHIGSKNRESPSPEGKRAASVGLVGSWKHAAPGHQSYVECFFNFNGTSSRGKFLCILHRVGMELSCKLGRPFKGMGSIDSPTHIQKDCVESDLSTLKVPPCKSKSKSKTSTLKLLAQLFELLL
eukprot:1138204-Pelagomonas_calceolata.AAC.2